jgi:ribosomal protein S18 acetylase RimI-like enzyme
MHEQKLISAHRRLERYFQLSPIIEEKYRLRLNRFEEEMKENVALDCGWGKLLFGQTFRDHQALIAELAGEKASCRDIALYTKNHHVLLSHAPELLFVDPSDTFRLWLNLYRAPRRRNRLYNIRLLQDRKDAEAVNTVYRSCGMLESPIETILENQYTRIFCYYLAERIDDGRVVGTISGIDHREAFNDPANGSSFWNLSVDPSAQAKGVGKSLVREVIEHYIARGREYLDLSVMHDNKKAKRLYRSLGFRQIPVYAVKLKNEVNRDLYRGGPVR